MKIKWIGPRRWIPDLGEFAEPGDELEIPAKVNLGGEGTHWEKVTTKSKKGSSK